MIALQDESWPTLALSGQERVEDKPSCSQVPLQSLSTTHLSITAMRFAVLEEKLVRPFRMDFNIILSPSIVLSVAGYPSS